MAGVTIDAQLDWKARSRRLFTIISLLLAVVPIGRAQQQRPGAPPVADLSPHAIHGRVVADDGGASIHGALVALVDQDATHPSVLTDSDGRFTLAVGPQGSEALSVSKTGYAAKHAAADDEVEIRLEKGAAITGRVLDDGGTPVPLMSVTAERRVMAGGRIRFERQASAETDDTGEYRLFGLSAGDYVVGRVGVRVVLQAGNAPNLVAPDRPARDYYPHATEAAEAQVFSIRAGTELNGIDFTLQLPPFPIDFQTIQGPQGPQGRTGSIRGRVSRADGLPVRRARVELSPVERSFAPRATMTDDAGRYEFGRVPAGRYLVAATDIRLTTAAFAQRRAMDRGDVITLAAGGVVDDIDVSMPRPGAIVGRIFDESGDPIEGVSVRVEQVRWSAGRTRLNAVRRVPSRQTNDLGRFRLFGLSPGRYMVKAAVGQPQAEGTDGQPGYVPTYFPGTPRAADGQLVEVTDFEDALNVEFGLARGREGRISGRVLKADGQPFDGLVHLIASQRSRAIANEAPARVRTDETGSFSFDHLPPGEFVVQAATSREGASTEGEFGVQFVTVNASDVSDVVVRMSVGSSITGHVIFEGGAPPAPPRGLELSPVPSDPDFASLADNPVARADVHEDWSFEMHGVSGPRRLMLIRAPDGWTLQSIRVNGEDVTDAPVLFGTQAQSVSEVDVVLTSRTTTLAGIVTDARGRPFSDSRVIAFATQQMRWYPQSRFVRQVDTTLEGTFTFTALPPGDYYVVGVDKRDVPEMSGESESPEFLRGIAGSAARIALTDGQRMTTVLRVSSR
jgi:hypothetical protein